MKKLLSLVLAAAMLCSFAFIAAAANEAPGDLQAQGRALLEGTWEIIDSRQYTLTGPGYRVTVGGGDSAREYHREDLPFLWRLFLGSTERNISRAGIPPTMVVYPERRLLVWMMMTPLINVDLTARSFGSNWLSEDHTVYTTMEGDYILVTVQEQRWEDHVQYFRYFYCQQGQLRRLETGPAWPITFEVDSLTPGTDESMFNTRWMLPVPLFLLVPFFIPVSLLLWLLP